MLVIHNKNVPLDSIIGAYLAETIVTQVEFERQMVTPADLFIELAGLVFLKDRKLGEECLLAIMERAKEGNPLAFGRSS